MKNLVREIHSRSLWQVLGIYLVGSWIALQVVDVLANNFGLPEWFPAFALALLVLGLPVVLATAFVQEGVGVRGGDGEDVPAADPTSSAGPAPQLFTWRNAVIGGVGATVIWAAVAVGWFALRPDKSGAELATAAEVQPSIAVLPFAARSATQSDETDFFAEGMHDDLLTQLSKIEALTVISRTSVMQFRDTEMAIPAIAAELGVANVLEGAVDRAGDRIRVNVQLIEAETDRHLWAETYDEEFTAANVFAIRGDLSRKIAEALHATLSPSVDADLASTPTESLEAYDLNSRGRFVLSTRGTTREGVEDAIDLFRRAIEADPEYAPAYAGLSQAYVVIWNLGYLSDEEALPPAREAADRALALDPSLADAHVADGRLLNTDFKSAEAMRAVERALELSPGHAPALAFYSSLLLNANDMEGSVAMARRAVEIDPLAVAVRRSLVARLAWAGLNDEAILEAERLLELDPNEADGHYYTGVALDNQGRYEEAIQSYERAIAINSEDPYYPAAVAYSHALLGDREQAMASADKALEAGVPLKELALIYSAMGDMDTAFEWLARAAEAEPGTLFNMDADPTSDALRADPRYEQIIGPLRSN